MWAINENNELFLNIGQYANCDIFSLKYIIFSLSLFITIQVFEYRHSLLDLFMYCFCLVSVLEVHSTCSCLYLDQLSCNINIQYIFLGESSSDCRKRKVALDTRDI